MDANQPPRYRGVSWHVSDKKWRVKLKHRGRHYYLGNYTNPEDAARVYDVAARLVHGPDAQLNFDGLPPTDMPEAVIRVMMVRKGLL